MNGSCSSGLI